MSKAASNKKTVISGEYGTPVPARPSTIGFKRSSEELDRPDKSSLMEYSELAQLCGQRSEVDNTIITVVRSYMEKRSEKCYKDGLDKELMLKLDKIFIKYYDRII